MNKTIYIASALIVIFLGYYLYTSNSDQTMSKDKDYVMSPAPASTDQQMKQEEKMMEESPDDSMMMKKSSGYVPFEDGVLDAYSSSRRILFFYASWCPTCRPVDAELTKRVAEIPEGVVVIRVNYNDPETDSSEKDLATKYGVTYQHTLVELSSDGKKVQSWNGGSVDMLLEKLN